MRLLIYWTKSTYKFILFSNYPYRISYYLFLFILFATDNYDEILYYGSDGKIDLDEFS